MKKIIVTLLALVFVVSMVGCGSGGTTPKEKEDSTTSTKATASETKVASGESQKLVIWAWDQNLATINYAAEKYKAANPDANVEVVVQNVPDTVTKISTFFASGVGTDLPDIVLMDNIQIQAFVQQFPDKFVNLSQLGFDEFKDSFSKAHWELLSHEGSIYAFPFDIAPLMTQVNTEIMTKAGVDPATLKTWDDVIAATKAVNDAGFAMHVKFAENEVLGLLQSAGVGLFDVEGNIDLLNPKVVETIELYIRIQQSNASDTVAEGGAFGEGTVALNTKPAWAIGEDMPVFTNLEGKSTLIPLPKIKDEAGYTNSANNGGSSFFILETSKVKEAAYEIGKIIATDLEAQDIALSNGLMPGYLPAAELDSFKTGSDYYGGQEIWKLLSESAAETLPVYVNEFYSTAKDIFKNTITDPVRNGTDKTAKELLEEAADLISAQTGLTVNKY